jgi:hypothetical protein
MCGKRKPGNIDAAAELESSNVAETNRPYSLKRIWEISGV